jgi:hypothetical protein
MLAVEFPEVEMHLLVDFDGGRDELGVLLDDGATIELSELGQTPNL